MRRFLPTLRVRGSHDAGGKYFYQSLTNLYKRHCFDGPFYQPGADPNHKFFIFRCNKRLTQSIASLILSRDNKYIYQAIKLVICFYGFGSSV